MSVLEVDTDGGRRDWVRYVIIYAHKLSIEIVVVDAVVFVKKRVVLCGDMYGTSQAQPQVQGCIWEEDKSQSGKCQCENQMIQGSKGHGSNLSIR